MIPKCCVWSCLCLPQPREAQGMSDTVHPPPNNVATTVKLETFTVKLASFCSAPLQSSSSVSVSQWADSHWEFVGSWHAKP